MTQAEVAKHLDMSVRNLHNVLKMIELSTKNLDVDTVRIAYIRHLRGMAARHQNATGGATASTLTEERLLLTKAKREVAEFEVKKLRGELVDSVKVHNDGFQTGRTVRDNLMLIPGRIAALLAAEDDAKEVERILEVEIHNAIMSLISKYQSSKKEMHHEKD